MSDRDLSTEVKNLVAKHALCQPEELSTDTRIGEDLRIVGDDADELLTEFSAIFDVDMSNMDFGNYFPSEATANMHYYLSETAKSKYRNPVVLTFRFLEAKFWRLFAKQLSYQTITIGELVNAASNGKW